MAKRYKQIETKLIHAGEPEPLICGAVSMPVFQSAMFEYMGETSYHDLKYIRLNNTPNHTVLHQKLAALENAEAALVTASGMAAISTSLLTVLKAGDHLLAQDTLYGGTHDFITQDFASYGISFDFIIIHDDDDSWEPAFLACTVSHLRLYKLERVFLFRYAARTCTSIGPAERFRHMG